MDIDLRTFDMNQLEVFFQILVKQLLEGTTVEGVTYRGTYYQADGDRGHEVQDQEFEEIDPAIRYQLARTRYGAWEVTPPINAVAPATVNYRFIIELPQGMDPIHYTEEYPPDYVPLAEAALAFMDRIRDVDDTRIILNKPLLVHNNSRKLYNGDPRAADLLPFRLPQEQDIMLPAVFTLRQLVDALIRIKSHHFEWWYEQFGECHLTETLTSYILTAAFHFGS